jgi:hypothetical protein
VRGKVEEGLSVVVSGKKLEKYPWYLSICGNPVGAQKYVVK